MGPPRVSCHIVLHIIKDIVMNMRVRVRARPAATAARGGQAQGRAGCTRVPPCARPGRRGRRARARNRGPPKNDD
eukprot:scaffold17575_cov63-Phaeocystis_antarctica.AAC.3